MYHLAKSLYLYATSKEGDYSASLTTVVVLAHDTAGSMDMLITFNRQNTPYYFSGWITLAKPLSSPPSSQSTTPPQTLLQSPKRLFRPSARMC